jgi:glycosyltransferase involved in cell wall biosynthesis
MFVDQRWVDLVPGYFEHTICTDPGANVAYWNLSSRRVKRSMLGYEVNGRPLQFFHFSGFDPLRPFLLTKHQVGEVRIRLDDHPAVAALCQAYARQLLDAGYLDRAALPYHFNYTTAGVRLDARMRMLYRETLLDDERDGRPTTVPDPFDPAQSDAFLHWLSGPVQRSSDGAPAGRVSRYLRSVYDERLDLQAAFGDLDGGGGDAFCAWMAKHGRTQAALPPELVPMTAHPDRVKPDARQASLTEAVNVVGYLHSENGVGQVARALIDTLRAAGLPYFPVSCNDGPSRRRASLDLDGARDDEGDVSIVCVNADELPMMHERLGASMPAAMHRVGVWAWEVEAFPEWMARSAALLDEVWVYSQHAASAVSPMVDVPVHVFAPPIPKPAALDPTTRSKLADPEGFLVLFCLDFFSVAARKNPRALVEAYRRAFGPDDGARLVIKTVNGASFPIALAQLQALTVDRHDIAVVDGYARPELQRAIMDTCDCYVSLHRAEGYGLTMAEAMALGKPVIATGYSGNLEFMTADTAVLVPYDLVPIPLASGPYPLGARWAEADVDAAASALRRVAGDRTWARELGGRAREHIERDHGPAARAAWLQSRIDEVRSR